MNRKIVYLTSEQINDLITLINNRLTLGVSGNLIGEAKTIIDIVHSLEMGLLNLEETKKEETKK